jgi:hypothetical protein
MAAGHFSPSWLAALRFTSVEKRPAAIFFPNYIQ